MRAAPMIAAVGLLLWARQAVKVRSPCPRLYITAAVTINTTVRGEIRTWVLSHRSRPR